MCLNHITCDKVLMNLLINHATRIDSFDEFLSFIVFKELFSITFLAVWSVGFRSLLSRFHLEPDIVHDLVLIALDFRTISFLTQFVPFGFLTRF